MKSAAHRNARRIPLSWPWPWPWPWPFAVLLLLINCAHAPRPILDSRTATLACAPGSDTDRDGISDACELSTAQTFAPWLVQSSRSCSWDVSVTPARVGGEYLFGVERNGADGMRIVYLPAYYTDCGWTGAKCSLHLTNCDPHEGDSETIVVDLRENADGWRVERVFLSAHCFGRSQGDCRWFDADAFSWRAAAPVIWVAEGKHANYPSAKQCDRGHFYFDTCDGNDTVVHYPVLSGRQNIGSAAVPFGRNGCIDGTHTGLASTLPEAAVEECFWSERRFTGWHAAPDASSTPYVRYLRDIAGWQQP